MFLKSFNLTPLTNTRSKLFKTLNIRPETIKFLARRVEGKEKEKLLETVATIFCMQYQKHKQKQK